MAVDKKLLDDCILEAAGDDKEMADFLRDRYTKNDALAAKFVGGFTRTADYTRKTQELSDQRKTYETQAQEFQTQAQQLKAARQALEAAETEKNTIMRDLATHRVSTAKARELMTILRDKYQLNDDDLPGMSDLIETAKKGKVMDNTDDLDTRFANLKAEIKKEVEQEFVKTMIPELGAMADLDLVWDDITQEHQELTGKRLTPAEKREILQLAKANNSGGIRSVWEEKYQVRPGSWGEGLRMQKRDEGLKSKWQSEYEASEADKRQKQALEVVTGGQQPDLGTGPGISAAFKTRFREYPMDPNQQPGQQFQQPSNGHPAEGHPNVTVMPGQHVRQTGNRGPSGAERAAAKFLAQRSGQKTA